MVENSNEWRRLNVIIIFLLEVCSANVPEILRHTEPVITKQSDNTIIAYNHSFVLILARKFSIT